MANFRYAIMGAGGIARKFVDAVRRVPGCEVAAVASKSLERAQTFAGEQGVPAYYDSYETMLINEKPDCVYIATTPDSHFPLTMLCLEHDTPVLCEKAMFACSRDAQTAFDLAREKGLFVMEALWSRFLPANVTARNWLREGRIGDLVAINTDIGFIAPPDPERRYMSKALYGGAATDITCYAYELTTWMAERPIERTYIDATAGETGVDVTETVALHFEGGAQATLRTSFVAPLSEGMTVFGTKGRIFIPHPHFANEAFLYEGRGPEPAEHFVDENPNGFVFEVQETMDCIRAGKVESDVVPHSATLECARVFDEVHRLVGWDI